MQPPTLAPLALEPERVLLRGQRTPKLLSCLPDNREEISQSGGPDRVCCCVPLEANVPTVCVGGICFRIEHCILARARELPDWRRWVDSLQPFDGRDLGRFVRTQRWDGANWVGTPLYYDQPEQRIVGPGGMYRLTQEAPARAPLTVCFDAEQKKIVRGDWYSLRFLVGRSGGTPLHAEWEREGQQLFVPVEERWPFLYEQILVQASGLLPSRGVRPGWLCYPGIPEELAKSLCGKLDVEIGLVAGIGRSAYQHAAT